MKDCLIFDLDGTLCDCRHRLHHVTQYPKNWEKFFAGIAADPMHNGIGALLNAVLSDETPSVKVIFCSGRPDEYRVVTAEWLFKNCGVTCDSTNLFMRKHGDHRQDSIIKRELLAEIRAAGYNPILAIDDRPQVIEMWRSEGIPVLAVVDDGADGDQATQWAGETLLTVMVGPSGAGKSRWCSENAHAGSMISSDQIRAELLGDFQVQTENDRVFHAMHAIAKTRLAHGLPVVLDATHIRRKDRMLAASLAPQGTRVRYVVINRPMEEKIATGGWRNDVEGLLERHEQTFRSQIKDILAGDGLPNVDVIDLRQHERALV